MSRYVGLYTLPGLAREMLAEATPQLQRPGASPFVRAYLAIGPTHRPNTDVQSCPVQRR